jgi:23S rRNA (guanosine2251-2'-O)-methyltransferase
MAQPIQGNARRQRRRFAPTSGRASDAQSSEWLWGWHAVIAALENPARAQPKRLLATAERARTIQQRLGDLPWLEVVAAATISELTPRGAVHQGLALRAAPIEATPLAQLAEPPGGLLVMLDHVTDPQNVGAIFRSAAAFGSRGVIVQDRHAPALAGVTAKAAAGAIDLLPHARVVNLTRTLDALTDLGWRAVGLAREAAEPLDAVLDGRPVVLVLGSEGEGLRRLVGEHCDVLAKIAMPGGFESLNVAAAAAVALYEATRPRG